nr:MAG TPA: hypothetical protein [Caudoviricetes sp.]
MGSKYFRNLRLMNWHWEVINFHFYYNVLYYF